MERDTSALASEPFDLIIIGGGIYGICAAWDAAQRGLKVALLEKADFAGATSSNSFKIVHGGIRYLQHGDVCRMRESSRERGVLLRIAPHLVRPLPVVIPTYGHGVTGKEMLRLGALVYDALTADRNRGSRDPRRRVPPARSMSRSECLDLFPALSRHGLTGAVVFNDAQMYNPPRLALSYLRSAVRKGATVANYMEVFDFVYRGDRVVAVQARDELSGETIEVRGKVVLNATGPWASRLLEKGLALRIRPKPTFSRDLCFAVRRSLDPYHALAVLGPSRDRDAFVSRGRRHLFLSPWRGHTLVGVWHRVQHLDAHELSVADSEIENFVAEVNAAQPGLALSPDEVVRWNTGLVLFGQAQPDESGFRYGKRSTIVDHEAVDGVAGLISLIGVRFTTSRGVAARVVDRVFDKLGRKAPPCRTSRTPIFGGDIPRFGDFARKAIANRPKGMAVQTMDALARNYGSAYPEVLSCAGDRRFGIGTLGESNVLKAEIVHAARHEMAVQLADVVFRRTELGTAAHPGAEALRECADLMATELRWDGARVERELSAVERILSESGCGSSPRRDPDSGPRTARS